MQNKTRTVVSEPDSADRERSNEVAFEAVGIEPLFYRDQVFRRDGDIVNKYRLVHVGVELLGPIGAYASRCYLEKFVLREGKTPLEEIKVIKGDMYVRSIDFARDFYPDTPVKSDRDTFKRDLAPMVEREMLAIAAAKRNNLESYQQLSRETTPFSQALAQAQKSAEASA